MNRDNIYKILQSISVELAETDDAFKPLPEQPTWSSSLEDLGIDMISAQEYLNLLEKRIPTKKFHVPPTTLERLHLIPNLGDFTDHLLKAGFEAPRNPEIVYVDDEQENLFVFKRKFGKRLNLKTFESPTEALDYITKTPQVAVLITDEVMPGMSGNQLCDEVHKVKPAIKVILITGNPNNDSDLMYRSLRQNRFYEFINKPVDFEGKGEEYFNMIQGLLAFDW